MNWISFCAQKKINQSCLRCTKLAAACPVYRHQWYTAVKLELIFIHFGARQNRLSTINRVVIPISKFILFNKITTMAALSALHIVHVIVLSLLFVTVQSSISLTAQVNSAEIVLINNGVVQANFADLLSAKSNLFLRVEDQPVTFSLSTDQDYSYSLTTVPLSKCSYYICFNIWYFMLIFSYLSGGVV